MSFLLLLSISLDFMFTNVFLFSCLSILWFSIIISYSLTKSIKLSYSLVNLSFLMFCLIKLNKIVIKTIIANDPIKKLLVLLLFIPVIAKKKKKAIQQMVRIMYVMILVFWVTRDDNNFFNGFLNAIARNIKTVQTNTLPIIPPAIILYMYPLFILVKKNRIIKQSISLASNNILCRNDTNIALNNLKLNRNLNINVFIAKLIMPLIELPTL